MPHSGPWLSTASPRPTPNGHTGGPWIASSSGISRSNADPSRKRCSRPTAQPSSNAALLPPPSTLTASALRRLAVEAADNGLLDSDIAAGIAKVKGARGQGVRTGNWLTKEQAETMLRLPDVSTLKGKRDRAMLSILIGCGLRRSEAAGLNVADIQQRDGRWVIPDLLGKHGRIRTVPMPGWAKVDIDVWLASASITTGRIFCAVHKGGGILRHSLTAQSIFLILVDYGQIMGLRSRRMMPGVPSLSSLTAVALRSSRFN